MPQTFYELLSLSPDDNFKGEDVKQAYRRALLTHHPDKLQQVSFARSEASDVNDRTTPTIDLIVEAYTTLLDPIQRKIYNDSLKTGPDHSRISRGIETFDLEDLESNEESTHTTWSKKCRCGSPEAYIVTEQDLERADEEQTAGPNGLKDILVGCRGCSLFIRVTFAVSAS